MNDLISRKALIAEYDRVHIGPPGGARKLMEDAPAVMGWIPVTERLPEEGENVLVFRDNDFAVSEIYMTDYEGKPMWNYTGLGGDPTHWMPLPPAPEENK